MPPPTDFPLEAIIIRCYLQWQEDPSPTLPNAPGRTRLPDWEIKQLLLFKVVSEVIYKVTSSNTYWSILKTFLNDKKIPCIPSVFHDNKFVIDFREKAELLNTFFCELPEIWYFLLKNV